MVKIGHLQIGVNRITLLGRQWEDQKTNVCTSDFLSESSYLLRLLKTFCIWDVAQTQQVKINFLVLIFCE